MKPATLQGPITMPWEAAKRSNSICHKDCGQNSSIFKLARRIKNASKLLQRLASRSLCTPPAAIRGNLPLIFLRAAYVDFLFYDRAYLSWRPPCSVSLHWPARARMPSPCLPLRWGELPEAHERDRKLYVTRVTSQTRRDRPLSARNSEGGGGWQHLSSVLLLLARRVLKNGSELVFVCLDARAFYRQARVGSVWGALLPVLPSAHRLFWVLEDGKDQAIHPPRPFRVRMYVDYHDTHGNIEAVVQKLHPKYTHHSQQLPLVRWGERGRAVWYYAILSHQRARHGVCCCLL